MHFIIHCALHSLPTWILGINVLFPSVNMDLPILGFACHDWCICYNFPMLPVVLYWTFFSAGCAFRLLDSHFLLCYTDDIAISLVMFCRCSAHLFILLPILIIHDLALVIAAAATIAFALRMFHLHLKISAMSHCITWKINVTMFLLWLADGVYGEMMKVSEWNMLFVFIVFDLFQKKGKLETLASFFGEWWRMTMQIDSPSLQRAAQSRWVCSNCQV
jgi:hypothetical protein